MIVYTPEQRRAFAPDLRRAQQVFDDVVMAMLRHRLDAEPLGPEHATAGRSARHLYTLTRAAVVAAFERHPTDRGLVFAELVDFAGRWGFSTGVLDEDSGPWTTETANPRTG